MKTREEQFEAWKSKRTKPLAAISNSNVVNRPPKPLVKRSAVLNKGSSVIHRHPDTDLVDKENQLHQSSEGSKAANKSSQGTKLPRAKQAVAVPAEAAGSRLELTALRGPVDGPTAARKAAVPARTLESMENQYDMLKGTLDTLKRESIRYASSCCTTWVWPYRIGRRTRTTLITCQLVAEQALMGTSTEQVTPKFWDSTMKLPLLQDQPCQGPQAHSSGTAHRYQSLASITQLQHHSMTCSLSLSWEAALRPEVWLDSLQSFSRIQLSWNCAIKASMEHCSAPKTAPQLSPESKSWQV